MSWKFWQPKFEPQIIEVSVATLLRWYFYDASIEDPNYVAKAVGMLPVSEEGKQTELQGSEDRLSEIMGLLPFIEAMADINSQAMAAVQFERMREAGIDLDSEDLHSEYHKIEDIYKMISMSGIISTLSSGVELGLIDINAIGGIIRDE